MFMPTLRHTDSITQVLFCIIKLFFMAICYMLKIYLGISMFSFKYRHVIAKFVDDPQGWIQDFHRGVQNICGVGKNGEGGMQDGSVGGGGSHLLYHSLDPPQTPPLI